MTTMVVEDRDALLIKVPKVGGPCEVILPATTAGGRGEVCFMTTQQVARILDQTLVDGLEGDQEGWIDFLGVASPGIAVKPGRKSIQIILSFPERRRTIPVYGEIPGGNGGIEEWKADFLLPPTLWTMEFQSASNGGHLMRARLYASETRIASLTDPAPLVVWPFGNADPTICWGNVSLTHLRGDDPIAVDNLFFTSRFNQDLIRVDRFLDPDRGSIRSHHDWFRALKNKPNRRFPLVFVEGNGRHTLPQILRTNAGRE